MEKNNSQITRPTTPIPIINSNAPAIPNLLAKTNDPTVGPSGLVSSLNNNKCSHVTIQRGRRVSTSSYTCTVNSDWREDEAKEFPMYIAMADLCITPTGFTDTRLREALCSKIELMCGEISNAYTNRTTHLLAAHANTTKVQLARERNLQVVTVEWIENIWNACKQNINPYLHASLPQFKISDFPIFCNLHFTFSNRYDLESKQFYENLLISHGGIVATGVKKSASHFYICQEPESEYWYLYAQDRDIPCLPLAWIIESINRKTLAKITEFEIRGQDFINFGATFNAGNNGIQFIANLRHSLRLHTRLSQANPASGQPFCAEPTTDEFDRDQFFKEVDNFVSSPGCTCSTTLLAAESNSDTNEQPIYEGNESFLDVTVIEVDGAKENLQDSLTFSVAG